MAQQNESSVIAVRDLAKSYGKFDALRGLSFDVHKGQIFGFLGPNGAGKTTALRTILNIIEPSSGSVSILGETSAMKVRPKIGYLPEERGLYKKMKAVDTIAYFATLKGMSRGKAKKKAAALLDEFGLGEFAKTKIEALSKGMAQKVQLLSTIAHDPDVLILDEPFSGLDPVNQQVLEDMILQFQREGRTIIFSTHIMQHAERLCDEFLIINKGNCIFNGKLSDAHARLPQRVLLVTEDDIGPIKQLPEIAGITMRPAIGDTAVREYEIELRDGANAQGLMKLCFDNNIRLLRFDQSPPSLHDIFIRFVGDDEAGNTTQEVAA